MNTELTYKIDAQRRLCIKKDLIELSQWIDMHTAINNELNQLRLIEKQLLKNGAIDTNLQGLRRKNALILGMLCKYDQELNTEYEYGKKVYDNERAKMHEKKRSVHIALIHEFSLLKTTIYNQLLKYHRR
ncbi:hypothetical protein [Ulvibacter antarcticus]|uniref:Uncharacterized protein n=1 Tax=Ulvibacter antarcticus TaxID=442714 RepID=A0A3L9YDK2_9FLAO|nr:hypothetical protein [Ulvibacter antarcticus]RMA58731.1 hypothetical protein BXY75_2108 [Ulvibacter antarcticus]